MRQKCGVMALGLLLALSAACGGGGGDKPDPAADKAKAQAANPKPADFPAGWNSKPHEALPGEDELAAEIAECVGISPPSTRASAQVRSPDFTSGFATSATSVITFVRSEEEAAADAAALAKPQFAECAQPGYAKQIQAVGPEGATVSGVTVTRSKFPAYGDRTVSYRVKGNIDIGQIQITVNIDLVWIFKDRAEVFLTFSNPGGPFPPEVARSVAAKVVERL